MKRSIAVLSGDGIGPEIMAEALKVLKVLSLRFSLEFEIQEALVGGAAWEVYRNHLPQETLALCEKVDAILFGSVGGPVSELHKEKWKDCEKNSLLGLRKRFGLNVNVRPVQSLGFDSPLIRGKNIDIFCVRELTGDIYFGEHFLGEIEGERGARDVMIYKESEIRSVAHFAFKAAEGRRKKLHSVDKANVLSCSRLWREVIEEVACEYSGVNYEHILVDNAAMQLVQKPENFDVLLCPNMFGDILSDLISVYAGSLGMIPSASLNSRGFGMYEPAGGSAPDIAGKNVANPLGQILSLAMMFEYSFGLKEESQFLRGCIEKMIQSQNLTADLVSKKPLSTSRFGDILCDLILS